MTKTFKIIQVYKFHHHKMKNDIMKLKNIFMNKGKKENKTNNKINQNKINNNKNQFNNNNKNQFNNNNKPQFNNNNKNQFNNNKFNPKSKFNQPFKKIKINQNKINQKMTRERETG